MSLHVHCHISGGHFLLDLFARLRYFIFSKELPVVNILFKILNDSLIIRFLMGMGICMNRYWRPLFMEMSICSTTTLNCRRLWFGFTSTQTFLNSTRWNAGVQSRRLQLQPVGVRSKWTKCPSPAKKTAAVASHHWAWSNGHQSFPMRMKILLGPSSRAFSSKLDDASHCHSLSFVL